MYAFYMMNETHGNYLNCIRTINIVHVVFCIQLKATWLRILESKMYRIIKKSDWIIRGNASLFTVGHKIESSTIDSL